MKHGFFRVSERIEKDTKFAIIGLPIELNSTQTRGETKSAPNVIRTLSDDICLTTEDGTNILDLKIADLGNLNVENISNIDELLKKLHSFLDSKKLNIENTTPIFLGGNHLITYTAVRFLTENSSKKKPYVISLDAHLDFYDNWEEEDFTHCTVMKRIYDLYPEDEKNKLIIIGARDIDLEERNNGENLNYLTMYDVVRQKNTQNDYADIVTNFCESLRKSQSIEKRPPLYVSIDLDALDPSVAPATGYPIPGGFNYWEIWKILKYLSETFTIIGFDLVEYAPNLDLENKMTGFLSVKIIIEFINHINQNLRKNN